MNILDKVQKLALESREMGNHQLTSLLYSVAMDVALTESNRYLQGQLKTAIAETKRVKSDLESIHMYKLSEELDVIGRDLEARLIQFSAEDPIQAVLNSYQIIHKIAQVKEEPTVNIRDILSIAEDDSLSDEELATEIKKRTMGLSVEDKQNILYVLEKDYNISIPLEKIAAISQEDAHEVSESDLIKNPKTKEQKEHNKKLVEKKINEIGKPSKDNKDQWMQSFPSSPSIWSGFAYEAIVPYQQSNQMNFWSLASEEQEKILNKIARVQK